MYGRGHKNTGLFRFSRECIEGKKKRGSIWLVDGISGRVHKSQIDRTGGDSHGPRGTTLGRGHARPVFDNRTRDSNANPLATRPCCRMMPMGRTHKTSAYLQHSTL
jgi:hypothetical protein